LGKALKVPVLVEGIESEEQLKFVRTLGCDEIQGYYCGHPLPEEEVVALLAAPGRAVFGKTAVKAGPQTAIPRTLPPAEESVA
jgi:predicted signal transduction protein with EAL and GGDEF domain